MSMTRPTLLTAGAHALRLENLREKIRYDALVLSTDPAWQPRDGRAVDAVHPIAGGGDNHGSSPDPSFHGTALASGPVAILSAVGIRPLSSRKRPGPSQSVARPLFVDEAGGDYRQLPDSPCFEIRVSAIVVLSGVLLVG